MEAKHKVGETIRVDYGACGEGCFAIGCIVTRKEFLDYYGIKNDANFPEEKNEEFIYSEETCLKDIVNTLGNFAVEEDVLDEDEITINNNIDPICKVWHGNKCIGVIMNTTALDDFLVQLKRKFDAGEDVSDHHTEYYQKSSHENFKLHIDTEYFTIDNTPEGFYDHIDNCMKELSGF